MVSIFITSTFKADKKSGSKILIIVSLSDSACYLKKAEQTRDLKKHCFQDFPGKIRDHNVAIQFENVVQVSFHIRQVLKLC